MECRGKVYVKGKGQMQTYWLINNDNNEKLTEISLDEKKALLSYGIKEIDDSTKRP